jgi:hypothetical protein
LKEKRRKKTLDVDVVDHVMMFDARKTKQNLTGG